MNRTRSLRNQLNYCITKALQIRTSKRSQRKQGVDTKTRIYSNKTASKLRDTAKVLSDYLNEHRHIRFVRDIKNEDICAFLRFKENEWTTASKREMISRIRKLETIAKEAYPNSNINFCNGLDMSVFSSVDKDDKIRKVAMTKQDAKIIDYEMMQKSRSRAKYAVHLASVLGARVEEIASIKPEDVNLRECTVQLTNCKNGLRRTVSFSKDEVAYFKKAIDYCEKNNYQTLVGDLKPASVDRAIRRKIEQLWKEGKLSQKYENTTIHAIRKMWARERLAKEFGISSEELSSIPTDEKKKAFREEIQPELGHGSKRADLYDVYISD